MLEGDNPPLARFGRRHPVVGGIVAAVVWGGSMTLSFEVATAFRHVTAIAIAGGASGLLFGVVMWRTWSRMRREL